jgi:NitT/TauT family transport system substrate-binding protein
MSAGSDFGRGAPRRTDVFSRLGRGWRPVGGVIAALATVAVAAGVASAAAGSKQATSLKDALIGPPPISSSLYANVATQQGYYKKLGLKMSFKYFGHGTDVSKSVLAGDENVGTTATTAVIPLIAQGAKLKILFGMNNVDWVVASSAPGVSTCASLKGQNVGTDGTNNARELYLAALLKTCGLTIDDINQVAIGSVPADISKAAIEGQVKTDVLHASELAQVQALSPDTKWTTIPAPTSLAKQFHYLVGFATEDEIAKNRPALVKFVASYILARNWMMAPKNLNAFAKLAAQAQGTTVPVALSGLKIMAGIPYWQPGLGVSKANLGNTVKTLVSIGTIDANAAPSYDQMVDPTIYRDAMKMVASELKTNK